MGQTLTHGIYLPEEGERNCYDGLAGNWQLLDGAVGTIAEHTTALAGKAPAVHTHTVSQITDFPAYGNAAGTICEGNDSRLSNARTPVAHTHVTSDVTDLLNSDHTWTGNQTYSGLTKTSGKVEHKAAIGADLDDFILNMETYNWGTDQVNTPESYGSLLALNREGNTHSSQYEGWLNQIGFGTTGKLYHRYKVNVEGSWSVWRKIYTNWDNYIPGQNNTYDLGSSSYQWNNLYAKNYYYNGTPWGLNKLNVWSDDQVLQGINTGRSLRLRRTSIQLGDPPPASGFTEVGSYTFADKNNSNMGFMNFRDYANGKTALTLLCRQRYTNGARDTSGNNVEALLVLEVDYSTNRNFYPGTSNTHNLGTSTNKWKSLNGINPGALSLPVTALNNTYDISGNITDLTGGNNSITAARTGWIFVKSDNATEISIENTTTGMGASDHSASAATLMVSVPVTSGESVNIIANCTSIDKAYLLPCQGNV